MTACEFYRRKQRLTIRALADVCGVHVNTITHIERGFEPRESTARAIASILAIDPGDLTQTVSIAIGPKERTLIRS